MLSLSSLAFETRTTFFLRATGRDDVLLSSLETALLFLSSNSGMLSKSLSSLSQSKVKTENMRAGIVTKSDVEEFVKLGCAQCIVWKMRRAPVKSLVDATLAPPGKKWSYDTLTLKVKGQFCPLSERRVRDRRGPLERRGSRCY
eukprot:scaffold64728_cov83-Phaeocystis_antarctica.AAC.1